MGFLFSVPTWVLAMLMLALLGVVAEIGYRLGVRAPVASEHHRMQMNMLQGAVLGLLALLLGFSFSLAAGRYDARRELIVDEANAIRTAHLRARLLAPARRDVLTALLVRYAAERLAFQRAANDIDAASSPADQRSVMLIEQMWQKLEGADGESAPDIVAIVAEGFNEVIDLQAKRRAALRSHVPVAVMWLLIVVAGSGSALLGYGSGLGRRRNRAVLLTMPVMLAAVILLIVDLDRPRRGWIVVSDAPLAELESALRR